MIEKPEKFIEEFVKAGADYLTIHVESTDDPLKVLSKIRQLGAKPGITLRPGTRLEKIESLLSHVDLVLVMTVEPGFGGQSFMKDQVSKIEKLKELRRLNQQNFLIEVDGGVNQDSLPYLKDADVLVAGSFVFGQDHRKAIEFLKRG
jgi:ribulose-phosphate 3-epimerase